MYQKEVNLLELSDVIDSDNDDLIHSYLKIHDFEYNFSKNREQISVGELKSYGKLIHELKRVLSVDQMRGFYLGFKLKNQADTQFDLLKTNNQSVINFEFKNELPKKSISHQASEHYRFLIMEYPNVKVIEYINKSNELYKYDVHDNKMKQIGFRELAKDVPGGQDDINKLLNLTRGDFIISPYNQPEKFLKSSYELTDNQKEIKKKVLKKPLGKYVIKGNAGSGKTLLLLDILKYFIGIGKSICMIMGAKPDDGQRKLCESMKIELLWYYNLDTLKGLEKYDIIAFDESQRVPLKLVEEAINISNDKLILFNVDGEQVLHPVEELNDIQGLLEKSLSDRVFELRKSIRINPILSGFRKRLFDRNVKNVPIDDYDSVGIRYFKTIDDSKQYVKSREEEGFQVIEMEEFWSSYYGEFKNPKKYSGSKSAKKLMGQEFDNVLVYFDKNFYYKGRNKLVFTSERPYPYLEEKMMYEAMTRASKKIEIVIIGNIELYSNIQAILTLSRDKKRKDTEEVKLLRKRVSELEKELKQYKENV
ncbi:hypothetical protein [Companilactobacillus paralimentarius]|uniref:hypothetical protein n=1 Tax=Companilactobacillus paralimentarius TaxID=83526 RepID=UPI00384C64A5